MSFRIAGMELYVSFYAVAGVAAFLLLDKSGMASAVFAAALLHECGHFAALRVCRARTSRVRISLSGVLVCADGAQPLSGRLLMLLSGCAANIAAALFCALMLHSARAYIFSAVNTVLALINLMPLSGSDGGEALREILSAKLGEERGARISGAVAIVCSTAFIVLVAALTLRRGRYLWGGMMLLLTAARLFSREVE